MTFANFVAVLNNYVAISSIKYVSDFEYFLVMIYNKKRRPAKLIADLGKRKRLITCSLVQAPQKLWLWVCGAYFLFLEFLQDVFNDFCKRCCGIEQLCCCFEQQSD